MRYITLILTMASIFIWMGCQKKGDQEQSAEMTANANEVTVEEVIQASRYTYIRVKEKGNDYWIAATKQQIEKGETLYFDAGLEMKNFTSKDLNRTFETIFFVDDIRNKPFQSPHPTSARSPNLNSPIVNEDISVEPVEGGITIAELYSNRGDFANKQVRIRGQVTKFNRNIMGRNWVHLQDGTEDSGNFDLTITTKAIVTVGDVVTFEGFIVLDKDFGAGYAYDVLMEDSELEKVSKQI